MRDPASIRPVSQQEVSEIVCTSVNADVSEDADVSFSASGFITRDRETYGEERRKVCFRHAENQAVSRTADKPNGKGDSGSHPKELTRHSSDEHDRAGQRSVQYKRAIV